ncbi:MAG: type II toxin-antitoxin system RelE/ParE family toxin [Ruminococcus sp.]|jgi:mRNA-degrading endonuclease RelE of RelBE toxin-antitoxin system|nr:type II toxin-antitoxin system RelE/ParE family toxin [Ruminococcus sp.]
MIQWHNQALKQMAKLSETRREQIKEAVNGLPFSGDIRKLQGQKYSYRLRIGGYRIIYRLTDGNVHIDQVLPRGSAYKN